MNKNEMIQRFKNLDDTAIAGIEDTNLRERAQLLKQKKKQAGFTLLELLIVVAVLAIIAGSVLSGFGDKTESAAQATAAQSIAAVEEAITIYKNSPENDAYPFNFDALVCLDNDATLASDLTGGVNAAVFGGTSDLPGVGGGLGKKVADKFTLTTFPSPADSENVTDALYDAGIQKLRYAAGSDGTNSACDNAVASPATTVNFAALGATFSDGKLEEIDIPSLSFSDPRSGGRNRGRGFTYDLLQDTATDAGSSLPLLVWNPGITAGFEGYNSYKVGGKKGDVLVGLGVGIDASVVGNNQPLSKPPVYRNIARDKYPNYIALFKVGTDEGATPGSPTDADYTTNFSPASKATLVAVIDSKGDFLAEEIAEFTGQKN